MNTQPLQTILEGNEEALAALQTLIEEHNNDIAVAVSEIQSRWNEANQNASLEGQISQDNFNLKIENFKTEVDGLKGQVTQFKSERDALANLRDTMTDRVATVLASKDPEQYEALAAEFLTPEIEKQRAALLAAKAEIESKLEQLPKSQTP